MGQPVGSTTRPRVFISYRREETGGHAGRLHDALVAHLGEANVFMDVALAPGIDFVDRITDAVGASDVLLVVMGPGWAASGGRSRLDDQRDFVRLEIETALRNPDVTVIPLLVAGARMPEPEELPESIRELARRNALELSDARWRYDVERLVNAIDKPEEAAAPAPAPATGRPRRATAIVAALAALALVVAVLAVAGVFSDSDGGDGGSGSAGGGETKTASAGTTDDAAEIVDMYAAAYERRDAAGLRRLLDPDVVLAVGTNVRASGAEAVIARHARVFQRFGDAKVSFEWENDHSDSREGLAEVIGPYVTSIDGTGSETGRFGLLMRAIGSQLLIRQICFNCPRLRERGTLLP